MRLILRTQALQDKIEGHEPSGRGGFDDFAVVIDGPCIARIYDYWPSREKRPPTEAA